MRGLSLLVPRGEVFGLLGVNGAGKTSTLGVLTGDELATSGSAAIAGAQAGSHAAQAKTGFCPQRDPLLELLTAHETLQLYARRAARACARAPRRARRAPRRARARRAARRLARGLRAARSVLTAARARSRVRGAGGAARVSAVLEHVGLGGYAHAVRRVLGREQAQALARHRARRRPAAAAARRAELGHGLAARRRMWTRSARTRARARSVAHDDSMEEREALCHRVGIMVAAGCAASARPSTPGRATARGTRSRCAAAAVADGADGADGAAGGGGGAAGGGGGDSKRARARARRRSARESRARARGVHGGFARFALPKAALGRSPRVRARRPS